MATSYFAVLAIGEDTPGIVAYLAGILCNAYECNIETSQMAIVGGHFTSMLIASTASRLDCNAVEESLTKANADGNPKVRRAYVCPISADSFRPFPGSKPTYSITARTSDRRGVLRDMADVLAQHDINITTLTSGRSHGSDASCVIVCDVELPSSMRRPELQQAIDAASRDLGMDIKIDPMPPEF